MKRNLNYRNLENTIDHLHIAAILHIITQLHTVILHKVLEINFKASRKWYIKGDTLTKVKEYKKHGSQIESIM